MRYSYDAKKNILSVSLNDDLLQSYCYNASDELIRVNDQIMTYPIPTITQVSVHPKP
ncbi:hypothetical protein [Agathobacter ruminis]|nr:hypothetical protein [Agathobacter ruminis]